VPHRDRPKQDQARDQIAMPGCADTGGKRAPRVRHDRNACDVLMLTNELESGGNLPGTLPCSPERSVSVGRVAHLGIPARFAIAHEVERPDVEPGPRQIVHPRFTIEPVRSRERRRERRPVNEEHPPRLRAIGRVCGRQVTQEQLLASVRPLNREVFFSRIAGRR